jgi:hypothetical protein
MPAAAGAGSDVDHPYLKAEHGYPWREGEAEFAVAWPLHHAIKNLFCEECPLTEQVAGVLSYIANATGNAAVLDAQDTQFHETPLTHLCETFNNAQDVGFTVDGRLISQKDICRFILMALIAARANLTARSDRRSPLVQAAAFGWCDGVKLLLGSSEFDNINFRRSDYNSDTDYRDLDVIGTELTLALHVNEVNYDDFDIEKALIDHGAGFDDVFFSASHERRSLPSDDGDTEDSGSEFSGSGRSDFGESSLVCARS